MVVRPQVGNRQSQGHERRRDQQLRKGGVIPTQPEIAFDEVLVPACDVDQLVICETVANEGEGELADHRRQQREDQQQLEATDTRAALGAGTGQPVTEAFRFLIALAAYISRSASSTATMMSLPASYTARPALAGRPMMASELATSSRRACA